MKKEIWTTRKGKNILISDMSDRHLLNAHRMLKESLIETENFQHDSRIFSPSETTMAYDDFMEALVESYDICFNLSLKIKVFEKEIKRRGLKVLEPRVKKSTLEIESVEYTDFGKLIKLGDRKQIRGDKI